MALLDQRLHLRHIARLLAAPFSTMARALNRLGFGRLRNLEPKPKVQRYERETPGELIHIDVKKLARFRMVGHRITGKQQGRSAGVGYDKVDRKTSEPGTPPQNRVCSAGSIRVSPRRTCRLAGQNRNTQRRLVH